MTVAIGAPIGIHEKNGGIGASASLEYTFLMHEKPEDNSESLIRSLNEPASPQPIKTEPTVRGIGASSAIALGWQNNTAGWNAATYAGADYMPWMNSGGFINFGALIGYGIREDGYGGIAMAPRLGVTLTPWEWNNAMSGFGARVACINSFHGSLQTCGFFATATRITLGQ